MEVCPCPCCCFLGDLVIGLVNEPIYIVALRAIAALRTRTYGLMALLQRGLKSLRILIALPRLIVLLIRNIEFQRLIAVPSLRVWVRVIHLIHRRVRRLFGGRRNLRQNLSFRIFVIGLRSGRRGGGITPDRLRSASEHVVYKISDARPEIVPRFRSR